MEVRDKDLADLARLDAALLQLDLRALAAVKYPDVAIILNRDLRPSYRADNYLPNCSAVQETPRRGVGKQLALPRKTIFMFDYIL